MFIREYRNDNRMQIPACVLDNLKVIHFIDTYDLDRENISCGSFTW